MTQPDAQPAASPPPEDWRELRRRDRHARRAARRAAMGAGGGWVGPSVGGLVILILGIGLLLQNVGYRLPERWWALLLLLPAVGSLVAALRVYRTTGASGDTIGALLGGAIFTVLALALFFGVDWGIFWPIILIAVGGGIVLRSAWPRG